MTIKQQGGVFGRNPTFNDVTSNNVTTEDLYVYHPTTNQIAKFESGDATAQIVVSDNVADVRIKNTAGKMLLEADPNQEGAGSYLRFTVDGSTAAEFTASGNLAFPSGQGIDFSATAGTGTSELLDDYEEGTWNPVFSDASSGGNTATGSAYGYYIKVGGLVYVTGQFENVTTTGMTGGNLLYVQGIPYTPTSVGNDIFFIGSVKADGVTNSGFVSVESADSYAWLRFAETNGATGGHLTVSDFASGTADIYFSLCYRSIL